MWLLGETSLTITINLTTKNMKTFEQYSKENIIVAIIFKLPIIGISLCFIDITDRFYTIPTLILIYLYAIISSLKRWYNDYRFEELEKQINELKTLSNQ